MYLDLNVHTDYDKDIFPFIKNGIIIDTSIIDEIINGLISARISKKRPTELSNYNKILNFLEVIKVNNKWEKFFITPHILTEVCSHLHNKYDKWENYKEIIKEVMPIMENMKENLVCKDDFMKRIDKEKPVIEAGDISIFITTDTFTNRKEKIAILTGDSRLNRKYQDNPSVMVMDYQTVILNML